MGATGTGRERQALQEAPVQKIERPPDGREATPREPREDGSIPWFRRPRTLATMAGGALLAAGFLIEAAGGPLVVSRFLLLASVLTGIYHVARLGFASLQRLNLDMNFLMTVAAIGALGIGQWLEGAMVVFLFSVGEALEDFSLDRTRKSLRLLMEVAPASALVSRGGAEQRISVEDVRIGDRVIVRPGERIPVDGEILAGTSAVDQAAITGESLPVAKETGDTVFAGTINQYGSLEIEATRLVGDTMLAKIIHLVERAQSRKAPAQRLVDRFARYYTPAVVTVATVLSVLPPLAFGLPWGPWIYRGLGLLILACPCAFVISTPVAIVTAIGAAARHGVLIKGGAFLEAIGRLRVMAFDKTGTLTRGKPRVSDLFPLNGFSAGQLLAVAAAVESRSEHHLARAIISRAAVEGIYPPAVTNYRAVPGKGARGYVEGTEFFVGSPRFFEQELPLDLSAAAAVVAQAENGGNTVVLVGTREKLLGVLALSDQPRDDTKETLARLRRLGIQPLVMLTGDNEAVARNVADALGIEHFHAGLLPEGKARIVRELGRTYGGVGMVGDGINDAPALAEADVGIAMGVAGTDTALETADIALMADDLSKLPFVVLLGRRTLRIIRQNIIVALGLKALALAAIFPGWLTLWLAILADTGASLLVIGNALRLLGTRPE